MLFHKNYLSRNRIKETLQYSQWSSHPEPIQRHINSSPECSAFPRIVCGHVAGMVHAHVAALFSLSVRICTHLGHSELIFCSAFWPAATFPGKWISTGSMAQLEQQITANQWQMLECRTRILETHPKQTHYPELHTACCRGGHREKQAEWFCNQSQHKALAAAAIESEGCKGCTHPNTRRHQQLTAPNQSCRNCSLLPQQCSSHV